MTLLVTHPLSGHQSVELWWRAAFTLVCEGNDDSSSMNAFTEPRNANPFSALKLSHSSVSVAHEPVTVFAYGIDLLETKE